MVVLFGESFLAVNEICFPDLSMLYLTGVCFLVLPKRHVSCLVYSLVCATALPWFRLIEGQNSMLFIL